MDNRFSQTSLADKRSISQRPRWWQPTPNTTHMRRSVALGHPLKIHAVNAGDKGHGHKHRLHDGQYIQPSVGLVLKGGRVLLAGIL